MKRFSNAMGVLLMGLAVSACSAVDSSKLETSMISVTGFIANHAIICGEPFEITLTVENITHHEVYVSKHFNSNSCSLATDNGGSWCHGDSRAASFSDFVRLKPGQRMQIHAIFTVSMSGEGKFSVMFYNNLVDEVRRQLEETRVPFIVEVSHDFGLIKVEASKKTATGHP